MNKLNLIILTIILSLACSSAYARSGCCSWHGGVNHCDSDTGRIVCNDGTFSPSCMCEPNSTNPKFSSPQSTPTSQSEQQTPMQSSSNFGSATATCMAQNKSTGQVFSATGKGNTQSSATQNARDNVLSNCEQTSGSTGECIITSCSSSQF